MTDDRVTVTGSARRAVAPDRATWRAEAVESDDDPRAAFERCSARLNALGERLATVGEVATEAVVVHPEWDDVGGRRTSRAEAVGGVRVWSDAGRAGEVAQAAMVAGADRLDGPRFVYGGRDAAREELLTEAMADARRKAERLAAAAGRRLGRVRSVQAESDDRHEVVELRGGGPDVLPREETVTAQVTVAFALED